MHEDELGVIELLRRRIGFDVAMFNRPGGIATGALRTLCDLAKSKLHADRPVALRDEPGTRVGIARMHAQLAAARLLLRHAVTDAWSAAEAGKPRTMEQRARIWQAAGHAAAAGKGVVRAAYEAAGASALYESCAIERAHRDVHAAAQPVILQELWLEDAGRVRSGSGGADVRVVRCSDHTPR